MGDENMECAVNEAAQDKQQNDHAGDSSAGIACRLTIFNGEVGVRRHAMPAELSPAWSFCWLSWAVSFTAHSMFSSPIRLHRCASKDYLLPGNLLCDWLATLPVPTP